MQQQWACPNITNAPPDLEAVDPALRKSLAYVEKLTGAKGLQTCPCYYARHPWVHEAVAAKNWRDKGCLRDRTGYPSAPLVSAIDAIDRGDAMRARDDIEREKQKREQEREAESNR